MNKCDWCGADTGEVFPLEPPEVHEPVKVCSECKKKHEKDIDDAIYEFLFGLAKRLAEKKKNGGH